MSSPSKYKLTYYDIAGRAELIRWILLVAGQEFEDERLTVQQWQARKPHTPYGQIPILYIDGKLELCQSYAIARYFARKFGLAGKTPLEEAKADMMIDCIHDMVLSLFGAFEETDAAKKAEKTKKFQDEQLPDYLTKLEALLKANHGGDGYLVGDGLTWADMAITPWLVSPLPFLGEATVNMDNYPKLKALKARVEGHPKLTEWIKTHIFSGLPKH